MQPAQTSTRIAAVLGALAVILGAFGAHGRIHEIVLANGRVDNWQTAAHYHLVHAVALLALALAGRHAWPWRTMLAGTLIFSGSLYILALTNLKWLGAITPIGGLLMIIGWLGCARKA
jgi:uncharacterized membrane protein YgdD (TMEM256/DUF423 family)